MNLRYFDRRAEEYTKNLSAYLVLNRNTGSLAHKVVLGADYIRFSTDQESAMFEARQRIATTVANGTVSQRVVPLQFDLNHPSYEIRDPSTYVRRPTPQFFTDYLNSIYHTTGLYVQDRIAVTLRLGVLLGGRSNCLPTSATTATARLTFCKPVFCLALALRTPCATTSTTSPATARASGHSSPSTSAFPSATAATSPSAPKPATNSKRA